jgi:hypothetical protein
MRNPLIFGTLGILVACSVTETVTAPQGQSSMIVMEECDTTLVTVGATRVCPRGHSSLDSTRASASTSRPSESTRSAPPPSAARPSRDSLAPFGFFMMHGDTARTRELFRRLFARDTSKSDN